MLEDVGGIRQFWRVIVIMQGEPSARMRVQGSYVGWKPILWFVKGEAHRDVRDCFPSGGAEKTYHDRAQGLAEARYYTAPLTRPGERIRRGGDDTPGGGPGGPPGISAGSIPSATRLPVGGSLLLLTPARWHQDYAQVLIRESEQGASSPR